MLVLFLEEVYCIAYNEDSGPLSNTYYIILHTVKPLKAHSN